MKKQLLKGIIGIGSLLFLMLVFRCRIITLENNEKLFLYTPIIGRKPGGAVGYDLLQELIPIYGEEDDETILVNKVWKGELVNIKEISQYKFDYLGKKIGGGHYISCKIVTKRTIISRTSGKEVYETERVCQYVGYDDGDLNSDVRASVLWGTFEENYSDDKEIFYSILK